MQKLEQLIENKIVQNILLWLFLYLIFVTSVQSGERFLTAFYIVLFLVPIVYINNLVILPFFRKSKGLFFVFFSLNVILFSIITLLIMNYLTNHEFELEKLVNLFGLMLLTTLFASAFKFARDSYIQKQKDKDAELKLLKGQLNPHFLFNTLNNLYGLSVIKSDKLPNLMLKLSDLLRYSLYDTQDSLVPLDKEIQYIENYISLEKIRLEDKVTIRFTKSGDFTNYTIAPMLFIVFIENVFKHLSKDENSKVTVAISCQIMSCYFIVKILLMRYLIN